MKKVLIFSLAYYPRVGGAEVAIKKITNNIKDIEFHMVTMRFSSADKKKEKNENVTIHRVGQGSGYFSKILFIPLAAWEARRLHKTEKFDAVWVMMSYMLLPFLLSGLRIPYALTLQEGDTEHHMFRRLRILPFLPLINRGFRGATVVQVISNYLGTWARKRGFVGTPEIIPNGCDVFWFGQKIPADNRSRFWTQRGIPSNNIILITTSRLVHKNAVDDVIRALLELPKNIHFVICGEGPLDSYLKNLRKKLKLSERVHFMGQISNTTLVHYLHASNIFIRPSRSEGMGNSFIEAMAAGLPVIATQEGGLKDFISPEVAWVVEKNRPDQIALQIKDILGNPEHTQKVIESARNLAVQKYDWQLLAHDMREKVFSRLFT